MREIKIGNWVVYIHNGEITAFKCFNCGAIIASDSIKPKITLDDLENSFPFCTSKCLEEFIQEFGPINAYILLQL